MGLKPLTHQKSKTKSNLIESGCNSARSKNSVYFASDIEIIATGQRIRRGMLSQGLVTKSMKRIFNNKKQSTSDAIKPVDRTFRPPVKTTIFDVPEKKGY